MTEKSRARVLNNQCISQIRSDSESDEMMQLHKKNRDTDQCSYLCHGWFNKINKILKAYNGLPSYKLDLVRSKQVIFKAQFLDSTFKYTCSLLDK